MTRVPHLGYTVLHSMYVTNAVCSFYITTFADGEHTLGIKHGECTVHVLVNLTSGCSLYQCLKYSMYTVLKMNYTI